MTETTFTFKGSSGKEMNDIVFPGPPFELANHSYKFTLKPKSQFWRFGIRLSKSPQVIFDPAGRYRNSEFPDIQVVVGEMKTQGEWQYPNRAEIGSYYLEGLDNPLFRNVNYQKLSEIVFELEQNNKNKSLNISFATVGADKYEKTIKGSD